jgi:hypothetical protein
VITVTSQCASIIRSGGFFHEIIGDVIVDGDRKLTEVSLPGCEITQNRNAKIRTQATARLEYSDELGQTVVPKDLNSWLTPYATYMNIFSRISAGGFSEKILRGTLKVIGVKDPRESRVKVNSQWLSIGSSVVLTLADAFVVTDRERFPVASSPSSLASVWAEIGNVTGLPLLRNVVDTTIPRAVTYQESRLDAIFDLAQTLGGTPYVNTFGQVTIDPDAWGTATELLTIGPDGTVIEVLPDELTDEGIYNQVVVRTYGTDQVGILATAQLTSGPLRFGGPFGRIPYFASSQYITTPAQAQAYANSLLPKVSTSPASVYMITCLPDPRREVGDVVPFMKDETLLTGRIQELKLADTGPMTLKVLVDHG